MCRKTGYIPEREVHISRWNLEDSVRSYENDVYYSSSYLYSALTGGIPIIMRNDEGRNICVPAFWGILPQYVHDFEEAVESIRKYVNVRSETSYETTTYTPLLEKKQRCLIPCSYYFETHKFDQIGKRGKPLKTKLGVPFLVEVVHRPIFSIPAVYSHWYNRENDTALTTYNFYTITANDLMAEVHNGGDNPYRMPLVIDEEMEDRWLDPTTSKRDIDDILNHQIHSEQLSVYAVGRLSGKDAKTGAAIIEEEFWDRKEEIEKIKNTGKQKQWKTTKETV